MKWMRGKKKSHLRLQYRHVFDRTEQHHCDSDDDDNKTFHRDFISAINY